MNETERKAQKLVDWWTQGVDPERLTPRLMEELWQEALDEITGDGVPTTEKDD